MKTKQYNTYDECGRLIDENVNLKRAQATVKANPGSSEGSVKKKKK